MKIGVADYGISVWDGGMFDLKDRLEMLKKIGYQGVERLEVFSEADALRRAAIHRALGMGFTTCRARGEEQTIQFAAALGLEYVWLGVPCSRDANMETYCRQARHYAACCARAGIKTVLHNHMWTRIQNPDELDYFMEQCPEVNLLFDAGHYACAGGDCVKAFRKYYDRILALHLKDVWKDSDKILFRKFGDGNINFDLPALFRAVRESGYNRWVFVEQDNHAAEPAEELAFNLDYMRKNGLID